MEYTLLFPSPWEQINAENDNMDVCLTFPDGRSFSFVVATPENLQFLMKQDGKPYLTPGAPMLIAEKLTEEVVSRLMAELAQDEQLLNLYGSDITQTLEEER